MPEGKDIIKDSSGFSVPEFGGVFPAPDYLMTLTLEKKKFDLKEFL